jgi:hypothetical protein
MAGRGYLFALEPDEVRELCACAGAAQVHALLDPLCQGPRWAELDRAWVAIDRCLAAGRPTGPLARAILGGKPVKATPWQVVRLVPEAETALIAAELAEIDEDTFRSRFETTAGPEPEGESEELDLLYAWGWFQKLRVFYRAAAESGRAVVFAAELRRQQWRPRAVA